MATTNTTIKFTGQFDSSGITKGLQEIKKQMSNSHIGDELKKQLETALSKVEANIPALEKMAGKGEYNSKELEAFQKVVLQVSKDMQALDKLAAEADFTKAFSEADTNKLKNFEKQLGEIENKIKQTKNEIVKNFSDKEGIKDKSLNNVIEQLISVPPNEIENKLNEIVKEAEDQAENARENFQNILTNSKKIKTGAELVDFLFGKNSGIDIKHGETTRLKDSFNLLREAILSFDEDTPVEDVKAHIQALIDLTNDEAFQNPEGKQSIFSNFLPPEVIERLKQFQNDIPGLKALLGEEGLKTIADGEAEKLKLTQEQSAFLKQRLEELVATQQLTKEQSIAVAQALSGMNDKISEGSEQIKKEKAQADALSATFGSLANRITNSISALTVFNKSIQIVHKAIASVKELDAAFTQIAIVSEQSNESAWKMFDSFNKLAKQYSITTKDLTEGAKLFYQQGLNAADTMKMVEASTVSAALGEVTMTEAANTLTAAIQGYNESAAVAMEYTDKIAMVGAVSAADFNELSTAMEKTASSAYTAGIDFDHLLGYLGKMIEVTREAPANLGTAMKTIIARFEDMKKDPDALIDGASANKVETALATIGIALRDAAGEFRPLQDVFDELGMKWNTLTRNQQAYIATVAAGSRQQSRFLALMNNYDRTLNLVAESQNSAGAAAEQYAVYQDSAAAATARLTAAWEEFYTKIVNSEQIIWVLDRLKDLVEVMTKVGPVVSTIGASIGALGLQTLIKGVLPKITTGIAEAAAAGKIASLSLGGLAKGGIALAASFGKLILILGAIALAITAAVAVWKHFDKVLHPVRESAKRTADEIKKLNEKLNEVGKKTDSLEKLLNKYDELNKKTYRTKEEQEELNNTINEINDISDNAVISIDKMGNAHLRNREAVQKEYEITKEYNDWLKKEQTRKKLDFLTSTPKSELTEENLNNAGLPELANLIGGSSVFKENEKELEKINKILENIDFSMGPEQFLGSFSNLEIDTYGRQAAKKYNEIHGTNLDEATIATTYIEEFNNIFNQIVKESLENRAAFLKEVLLDEGQYQNELSNQLTNVAADYAKEWGGENGELLSNFIKNGNLMIESYEDLILFRDNFKELKALDPEKLKKLEKGEISLQQLIDSLNKSEEFLIQQLGKKVEEDAKEVIENNKKRSNQLKELKEINGDFYNLLFSSGRSNYITKGGLSDDDFARIQDIAKDNLFNNEERITIWDLLIEDDKDEINKKMDEFADALSNGLDDEADELKGQIIQLVGDKDLAEKLIYSFLTNSQDVISEYLSRSKKNFSTASSILKKDSTEALSDEEYSFLQAQNIGADRYIEINENGEKYLTVLGKIVSMEKARVGYGKSISEQILENERIINKIEKENKSGIEPSQQKQINNLRQQNIILGKQLDKIKEMAVADMFSTV